MDYSVFPVVLCGGSGTRLWPLSRVEFPKQFLSLLDEESLFQQTVSRLNKLSSTSVHIGKTLIVTNEQHRFLVQDQLKIFKEISVDILLESHANNTAPALTLAALRATEFKQDPILVISPADQLIQNEDSYNNALKNAIAVAASGNIVILGVKPTQPETGFGYIKFKGKSGNFEEFDVEKFAEKPSLTIAKSYINSEGYFWNSGIFVVRASVWLEAINFFRPNISLSTLEAFENKTQDNQFIRPAKDKYYIIPTESVDCAVLEQCPGSPYSLKMIPLNAGWSDLGSWDAVWKMASKDETGNVAMGDIIIKNSHNNLVHASHRLVSLAGVEDLVIIESSDAILITRRSSSQDVKQIVFELKSQKREEIQAHRKYSRPWGYFETIDIGNQFKVKRIHVKPGSSLSLQVHRKRSEHWVVVSGVAEVTCGDKVFMLHENQSTYIRAGEKHRLLNPDKAPLVIIEVQTGKYLGEDDIERFDDIYGRD